jgi:hypothetical protein
MCHAPTTGMTIGRLGGTVPEGAIRFSASAFIDNQQSRDVDFALIVGEDLSRIRAIAEGEMQPEPEEGFLRLGPGDTWPGQAPLRLPPDCRSRHRHLRRNAHDQGWR